MSTSNKISVTLLDDEGASALPGFPLEGDDYKIEVQVNPDVFLEDLSAGAALPDAVLLDLDFRELSLPGLDLTDPDPHRRRRNPRSHWGHDVLRTIKRIDPDLPVVMLSVYTDVDSVHAAGRLGAEDYIDKNTIKPNEGHPSQPDVLLRAINRAIELCKQRPLYDHEHRKLVDGFAASYDREERSKCATMAYYRYENCMIEKQLIRMLDARRQNDYVRVLDLGCGTGRVEEFILKSQQLQPHLRYIEIVGVDFSGKMLKQAYSKLSELSNCAVGFGVPPKDTSGKCGVTLFRAPVESLEFLKDRYPDGFDLVLMGFGLLSYVRYKQLLPSQVGPRPTSGVVPLVKPKGTVLFSVYNERSAIYEWLRRLNDPKAEKDLPIAAVVNLATGRLEVAGAMAIACEAFRIERVVRLLRQAGLSVDPGEVCTFPALHLVLQNSVAASGKYGFQKDPILPPGKYSPGLMDLDIELSRSLRDRGHYIVGFARRPLAGAREEKGTDEAGMHTS